MGLVGVAIMLGFGGGPVDFWGVAVSLGAMVASSFGYILTAKWGSDVPALTMSSWQLVGGSLLLIPVAILVEGPPPVLTPSSALGFAYLTVIATAVAYVAWFTGLRRLPAGVVGVVGLLNPVTGVVLGVAIAGEAFGITQGIGLALVLGGIALGSLPPLRTRRTAIAVAVRDHGTAGSAGPALTFGDRPAGRPTELGIATPRILADRRATRQVVMGWAHDPSSSRDRHAARLRRPGLLGRDHQPGLRAQRRAR